MPTWRPLGSDAFEHSKRHVQGAYSKAALPARPRLALRRKVEKAEAAACLHKRLSEQARRSVKVRTLSLSLGPRIYADV